MNLNRSSNDRILAGFQARAEQRGCLVIPQPEGDFSQIQEVIQSFDGALVGIIDEESPLEKVRSPMVAVRTNRSRRDVPLVLPDFHQAAGQATQHFLDEGLINLAGFAGSDPRDARQQELLSHFEKFAQRSGKFYGHFHDGSGRWSLEKQLRQLGRWLDELPKPVGILAGDYDHATRLVTACRRSSLSIPEQVAILSGDHHPPLHRRQRPLIGGVNLSHETIGAVALDQLLSPSPASLTEVPPVGVTMGQTSDRRHLSSSITRRTLHLLEEHEFSPLPIPSLCRLIHVSKSTLNREIQRETGLSTATWLRQLKLNEGLRLIRETDRSFADIAAQLGYDYLSHFSRDIKKHAGRGPRELRRMPLQ